MILTSTKITTSKYIVQRFSRIPNLCEKVGKTLIATTSDERTIKEALKINRRPPVVLNVVHGMFVVYEGNIQVCTICFAIMKHVTYIIIQDEMNY